MFRNEKLITGWTKVVWKVEWKGIAKGIKENMMNGRWMGIKG
jgi:hypothetical protein